MRRIVLLPFVFLILSAAACGQKGPLLLPDAKTGAPVSKPAPAQPPADKQDKNRPH